MDALVTLCSWNTNGFMVWAWMHVYWLTYALGTRTELWFEHGCTAYRMLLKHERNYGLGMDALDTVRSWNTNGIMVWAWMRWLPCALATRTELWFGHGCTGYYRSSMLLEHERICGSGMDALVTGNSTLLEHEWIYGLGMDALVTGCNTNGFLVWAWMLSLPYALGARTELWSAHGCAGHRMLLEQERNYGLSMDALVTVCSWNTNGIMPKLNALVTVCSWNTNGNLVWAWMHCLPCTG